VVASLLLTAGDGKKDSTSSIDSHLMRGPFLVAVMLFRRDKRAFPPTLEGMWFTAVHIPT
jgi:hypothetical protein